VADNAGPRKRLKEIKIEIEALKQKITALRTERAGLKATFEAKKTKKAPAAEKPA
jgi:phage shock protein A